MADNSLTLTIEVDPGATATLTEQITPILQRLAIGIVQDAKLAMVQPKTGRAYRVSRTRIHIASAPGEAPAVDTGALINSINWQMLDPLQAQVTAASEYAPYLEIGTRRMKPRPFLVPALRRTVAQMGIIARGRD